jgi:hypothetical protein
MSALWPYVGSTTGSRSRNFLQAFPPIVIVCADLHPALGDAPCRALIAASGAVVITNVAVAAIAKESNRAMDSNSLVAQTFVCEGPFKTEWALEKPASRTTYGSETP